MLLYPSMMPKGGKQTADFVGAEELGALFGAMHAHGFLGRLFEGRAEPHRLVEQSR